MFRITLVSLGLTLVACSGGAANDSSIDVRPFSEVQATDFVFEPDETDLTRAIFRVETTEPMICAIIWGETEEFGNFNNSLAMNGTGITQHDVLLPGAEPGVEYLFKVQGSTADGTLYESEVGTFSIPPTQSPEAPVDAGDQGPNLALDGTVTEVSSEFNESFAGSNAIDGDVATEWATAGSGDDAFITIDLGAEMSIAGVEFVTRSMADGTAITNEFTVTIDGEKFGPFPASNLATPLVADVETTGQVVRFDVVATTGGNTGAVEVRVFGLGGQD